MSDVVFEGERLYYSAAHPEGTGVRDGDTFAFKDYGGSPAYTRRYWLPKGYVAYESTVQHTGVVHEWTWRVSGYPGRWFMYAKSVKADRRDSGAYWFGAPDYLGDKATGVGYHV